MIGVLVLQLHSNSANILSMSLDFYTSNQVHLDFHYMNKITMIKQSSCPFLSDFVLSFPSASRLHPLMGTVPSHSVQIKLAYSTHTAHSKTLQHTAAHQYTSTPVRMVYVYYGVQYVILWCIVCCVVYVLCSMLCSQMCRYSMVCRCSITMVQSML